MFQNYIIPTLKSLLLLLGLSSAGFAQKLKTFSYYLSHPNVSMEAKNFYKKLAFFEKNHDQFYAYYDKHSGIVHSVMDSLSTSNKDTRAFYYYLMNRIGDLSDGSITEDVADHEMKNVLKNAGRFFHFMQDNPVEQKKYLSKWAGNLKIWIPQTYCDQIRKKSVNEKGEEETRQIFEKDPFVCNKAFRNEVMATINNEKEAIIKLAGNFFNMIDVGEENAIPKDTVSLYFEQPESTLKVKSGTLFRISFPEKSGGTGYSWNISGLPGLCKLIHSEMITKEHPPGMTGVPQTTVLIFATTKKGSEKVIFTFNRTWEKDVAPVETKSLLLVVE